MTELTTEQFVTFTFGATDGRDRAVAIDGQPTAASSDETVATVAMTGSDDGKTWKGEVRAVAPGSARISVTADADISPEVNNVLATADVTVTLDPRTGARMAKIELAAPADKPV